MMTTETPDPPTTHRLACPSCNGVDQVQKVSAAYTAGLATGRTTGVAGTFDGAHWYPTPTVIGLKAAQQSALSRQLAAPPAPRNRSEAGPAMGAVLTALGVLLCGLALAVSLQASTVAALGTFVVSIIVAFWAGRYVYDCNRDSAAQARAANQAAQAAYDTALARWFHLWMCARCDGLFEPGVDSLLIPVSMMHAALYAPAP